MARSEADTVRSMIEAEVVPPGNYQVNWNKGPIAWNVDQSSLQPDPDWNKGKSMADSDVTNLASSRTLSSSSGKAYEIPDSLMSLFQTTMQDNAAAGQALAANASEKKSLSQQSIDIAAAMMQDVISPGMQKREGDLAAQEAAISARDQLGNNPTDPDSLMAILIQDFRENMIAGRQQQAAVAAKQQVTLFDDPLQAIVNYVTLPDEINAMNATFAKAETAQKGIAQMQSLTTASAQAQHATAKSLTNESIAAQARVDIADSVLKLNDAKIKSLSYDAEGIKALEQANAQGLQMAVQKTHLEMQAAQMQRQSEEHALRMAAFKDKQGEMDDETLLKIVNAGTAILGQPQLDLQTIKWMTKTAEGKRKFDVYFEQGMAAVTTNSKVPGATPGEAIMNVLEVDGLRGPENKIAKDFLTRVARDAAQQAGITKFDEAGKRALAAKINEILVTGPAGKDGKTNPKQSIMYRMASDVEAPGSILKAPDLPQLVTLPAVQSNVLFKDVLAPAAAAGFKESSPDKILALAFEAKNRGLVNNNQIAKGMADLYSTASATAYVSGGAAKFGLPYRPSYVAGVPSAFSINSASKDYIDFSEPSSVLSYITALEARRRINRLTTPPPTSFGRDATDTNLGIN